MKLKFLLCVSVFVFSGGVFSSDLSSICSFPKYSDALAGDLVVHVAEVPSLAESSVKGGFINFIKALDEVYKYGVINVRVYPYTRAIYGFAQGDADFNHTIFINLIKCLDKINKSAFYRRLSQTRHLRNMHNQVTGKRIRIFRKRANT